MRTYKKIFIQRAIIVLMIISLLPLASPVQSHAATKDFDISSDGTLSHYYGKDSVVTIPSNVKTIAMYAFDSNTSIREVVIPGNVTYYCILLHIIQNYAFVWS